jgi:glycogen debranching enzyme
MTPTTVSVLEGNTFVVSARNGDVDGSPSEPHGLFHRDTRFLSRLVLTIDGKTLQPLSTDDLDYFDAQFFLVPGTGSAYTDATLSVQRRRVVGDGGFYEELTIMNHAPEPVQIKIRMTVDADFADLSKSRTRKAPSRAASTARSTPITSCSATGAARSYARPGCARTGSATESPKTP